MKVEFVARQGDVHIFKIDEFPEGDRKIDDQCKEKILACGEASGHCHEVETESAEVFKILNKVHENFVFIQANEPTRVRHGRIKGYQGEEADKDYHDEGVLPPGKYVTGIVEQFNPFTLISERVVD